MVKAKNTVEVDVKARNLAKKELKDASKDVTALKAGIAAAAAVAVASSDKFKKLAGATFELAKATAAYGDEAVKFQRASGINANTLATMRFAIQRWGGTQRDADTALRRFTKAVADASSGLETYLRLFRRLGMEQEDLVKPDGSLRSIDELLPQVADRFAMMTDATMKAAVAQDLFGRSGLRMVPMMNQGAAGMKDLEERARNLGILFSGDMLEDSEAFQDAMLDIREAMKGVTYSLGRELLPAFTRHINALTENVMKVKDFVRAHDDAIPAIFAFTTAMIGTGGLLMAVTSVVVAIKKLAVILTLPVGPIAIAIAAVTALSAAFTYFILKSKEMPGSLEEVNEAMAKNADEIIKTQKALADAKHFRDLAKTSTGYEAYQNRVDQLEKKLRDLTATQDDYNDARTKLEEVDRRNAEMQAKNAELMRRAAQRAHELKRAIEGIPGQTEFEFRMLTGEADIEDAIDRQRQIIGQLEGDMEKLRTTTEEVTEGSEAWENAMNDLRGTTEKYWAAKVKLVQLLKTKKDLMEETADGAARYADELERLRLENEELREQISGQGDETRQQLEELEQKAVAVSGRVESAFGSAFGRIMDKQNKFRDSWSAFWTSVGNEALRILARFAAQAAKFAFLKLALNILAPGAGSFIGAPVSGLSSGPAVAQGGGEIMVGTRGYDTVPLLAGRGENVLDTNTNDRLKGFLSSAEAGAIGGVTVQIYPGLYTGTEQEAVNFGNHVKRNQEDFVRDHIAQGIS